VGLGPGEFGADRSVEFGGAERLLQEAATERLRIEVAGHQDDLERRVTLGGQGGEFEARHAGHADIADHHFEIRMAG